MRGKNYSQAGNKIWWWPLKTDAAASFSSCPQLPILGLIVAEIRKVRPREVDWTNITELTNGRGRSIVFMRK